MVTVSPEEPVFRLDKSLSTEETIFFKKRR